MRLEVQRLDGPPYGTRGKVFWQAANLESFDFSWAITEGSQSSVLRVEVPACARSHRYRLGRTLCLALRLAPEFARLCARTFAR